MFEMVEPVVKCRCVCLSSLRQHSESQEWSTKFYFVRQQYYNTVHTQLTTLINKNILNTKAIAMLL